MSVAAGWALEGVAGEQTVQEVKTSLELKHANIWSISWWYRSSELEFELLKCLETN